VKSLLVLIALLLTACGAVQGGPPSHGGPVQDQVSLIDTLRSKNVTVDISGGVSQPFLSAEAKQIHPDGSGNATTVVDWVAPPHFFLKGRVLVIYLGSDATIVSLLSGVLGSQFAGI